MFLARRALSTEANGKLRVALILGSTRTDGPPNPVNIGKRIGKWIANTAEGKFFLSKQIIILFLISI